MLFAQSGDDVSQFIKKGNNIMDLLEYNSLPRINAVLDSTRETVDSSNIAISNISTRSEVIFNQADGMIADIRNRINDLNLAKLLDASADLTEQGAETLEGLNASREEITEAHVELMNKLGSAVDQYGQLGSESADFVHGDSSVDRVVVIC
jgi:hypothetical protein